MLIAKKCLGTVAYMGGVPFTHEEFTNSWGQMIAFTTEECKADEYVHFDRTKASLHDVARNDLANRMRGEWLFMLDADHAFEPDLVLRMLDRLEITKADVLVGIYQYKNPPHSPVLYVKDSEFYRPIGDWGAVNKDEEAHIFPVDAAGGGCLMVRRSVFSRIKTELGEDPFDRKKPLGEDMSFFKRCELLGIKVYCDARIEFPHLQVRPITLDMYDREALTIGRPQAVDAFALKG